METSSIINTYRKWRNNQERINELLGKTVRVIKKQNTKSTFEHQLVAVGMVSYIGDRMITIDRHDLFSDRPYQHQQKISYTLSDFLIGDYELSILV